LVFFCLMCMHMWFAYLGGGGWVVVGGRGGVVGGVGWVAGVGGGGRGEKSAVPSPPPPSPSSGRLLHHSRF
jgi:hypothetical protein